MSVNICDAKPGGE